MALPISPDALAYALSRATPAERARFAQVLGSGWIERHGPAGFDAEGLAEAVELMGGGRNRRFNSNERRIRDAGLALMSRYPLGGGPTTGYETPATGYTPDPYQPGAPLAPAPAGAGRASLVDQLGGPVGVGLGIVVLYLLARRL